MTDSPQVTEAADLALSLRQALEQTRKQAEEEIARLSRRLAEREHAAERGAASATERQAMQQDLQTLQHALGQKEKTLDQITDECRRLEDALEDQHVAFDGLRQEVAQKDNSLAAARNELERLRRQLAEVKDQSVDLSGSGLAAALQSAPGTPRMPPVVPDPPRHAATFSAGLITGLAVLDIGALVAWGGIDLGRWLPGPSGPAPSDVSGIDSGAGEIASETLAALSEDRPVPTPDPAPTPAAVVEPPTEPPRTLRDPLRGGGQGPTMAVLEGGPFIMGNNSLSGGDSGPEHEVRVAPFLIGAYEVTFRQYDAFARATGRGLPKDFGWGRGDRPVVSVSWGDAEAYAAWLARQTGRAYRLPSEAEWEFAARGGGRGSYWWGFGMHQGRATCLDCGTRWDNRQTAPVGSFPPSPYGLFDTAGNVMEWVADCYKSGYADAPTDSRARLDGGCALRVARGGAFNKPSASMRTWFRNKLAPDARLNHLGFRVARDP
jgi:formylglycine-generating enzyme required for sulfatase activity